MNMTLEQGIIHAKEASANLRKQGNEACAAEHDQMAEWLTELKERRVASMDPKPVVRESLLNNDNDFALAP